MAIAILFLLKKFPLSRREHSVHNKLFCHAELGSYSLALNGITGKIPILPSSLCSFALQHLTNLALYLFAGKIPKQVRDDILVVIGRALARQIPLLRARRAQGKSLF